jgi:tetratricopeptide (TPR) repeat protein
MYLKLVVWPWPLLIHYEFPYLTTFAAAWPYVVPLFLLGIGTLVLLWQNTPLGFLGTWLFAILSPTFLIPIVSEMAAERRMYLALAPLVVMAVLGVYRLAAFVLRPQAADSRARVIAIGLPAALVAIVFCAVSAKRLAAYGDEMNLWLEVSRFQPHDYRAPQSIGTFLERRGDDAAAIEQYRQAIRLNPDASLAHYSLAVLLNKRGAHGEAITHFAEAARIIPKSAVLRNNLAFAQYMAGRNDEAIDTFREALALDPENWQAYKNLGTALQKAGRYRESVESFQTALRLNPESLDIYNDLANNFKRMGQHAEAVSALQRGLELARASGNIESAKKFTAALGTK